MAAAASLLDQPCHHVDPAKDGCTTEIRPYLLRHQFSYKQAHLKVYKCFRGRADGVPCQLHRLLSKGHGLPAGLIFSRRLLILADPKALADIGCQRRKSVSCCWGRVHVKPSDPVRYEQACCAFLTYSSPYFSASKIPANCQVHHVLPILMRVQLIPTQGLAGTTQPYATINLPVRYDSFPKKIDAWLQSDFWDAATTIAIRDSRAQQFCCVAVNGQPNFVEA